MKTLIADKVSSKMVFGLERLGGNVTLAPDLAELRAESLNIEEMKNTIFEGDQAACCPLVLDRKPSEVLMQCIAREENIIQVVSK